MDRQLNTYVHVRRPDGSAAVFGPEDTVPDWARQAITNDSVWATEAPAVQDEALIETPVDGDEVEDVPPIEAPPRGGPGSGRAEWETFASSIGLDVDDDMSRDDIIDAIEASRGGDSG